MCCTATLKPQSTMTGLTGTEGLLDAHCSHLRPASRIWDGLRLKHIGNHITPTSGSSLSRMTGWIPVQGTGCLPPKTASTHTLQLTREIARSQILNE